MANVILVGVLNPRTLRILDGFFSKEEIFLGAEGRAESVKCLPSSPRTSV